MPICAPLPPASSPKAEDSTMQTHHTSLYHSSENPKPSDVFKQELVPEKKTEFGFQISNVERSCNIDRHSDAHISTPLLLPLYQD